ncbi:MAG: heavy metal-associated domain-containing protein [Candidatus Gracilibacteria bacterium]
MQTIKFKITNITCPSCVKLSASALEEIPGVSSVKIDSKSGSASVEANGEIKWETIKDALEKVGKTAEII